MLELFQLNGIRDLLLLVAILGTAGVAWWIYNDMPFHCVRMGVNTDSGKKERHGVLWVRTEDGGLVKRPFVVDKPQKLIRPPYRVVADLFYQAAKMGFYPDTIELMVDERETRIYRYGRHRPLVVKHFLTPVTIKEPNDLKYVAPA